MSTHCELLILVLALTLHGQVHTGRIFGGHEADAHSRPYMVLLEMHMQDGEIENCGGFLLSDDFVLTAAHCQASSYKVSLGVHRVRNMKNGQHVSVEQSYPHKNYNASHYRYDIMLLKLSSKAKLNNNVGTIALASQSDGSLPTSCQVSGWGRADRTTTYMSPVLREANVTLIDDQLCVENNMYCSKGETGPGQGDSGGPLICEDGKAYGVVSFYFKYTSDGPKIHGYTKIPDYRSWIDSIMEI
ncbi:granzyme-like protein 1 [Cottoperca gobio]|uniref:trypsin n=1 Tax=Cottoperca gobio TaxID=56716 RepID=A0A6J2PJS6_COTGO|nr:granzyme-like protein 1 [Cottoperca gobio]